MRTSLVLFHLAAFSLSSFVMLFQAYSHELPTLAYYAALLLFVAAITTSVIFGNEWLAVLGVLSFFLVVRLMFYVSTLFLVFPFGDPYGQFGVLSAFAQSSHTSILFPSVHIFDVTNYLAIVSNSYSQWPGLQILALSLATITGLSLLETAMILTLTFDVAWFMTSYFLVKKILQKPISKLPNLAALGMAIVTSLPTTEMPSFFKYDFPATVFLLVAILLLLRVYDEYDLKVTIPLIVLSGAIVVTHSITTVLWILVLLPFVLWNAVGRRFPGLIPSRIQLLLNRWIQLPNNSRRYPSVAALFAFTLISALSWWVFYAEFIAKYISVSLGKIVSSISLSSLSFSHLSASQTGAILTPNWIIELLLIRNRVFLVLFLVGAVVVIFRRAHVERVHARILILTISVITLLTELSGALSFGDRAFLLFAPLLGILYVAPLVLIESLRPRIAKVLAIFLITLFMSTIGIGFWASSYAPTSLYTQGADPSTSSGRPLSWPIVGSFLSFSGRQNCILTNEIYVTSLSVPVEEWNITKLIGNVRVGSGCLVVVYTGLFSASNLNVSSFGFGEPYFPYLGFSPSAFYSSLDNRSDRVFATGEETFFYYL